MHNGECLGVFEAQQFKLISADPNTIFQFFAYADYLVLLRIGTFLNQVSLSFPHIRISKEAVGLKDYSSSGLPTLDEARGLVATDRKPQKMRLEMDSTKSRELPSSDMALCEYRSSGLFSKGLHIHLINRQKLFFRFLAEKHQAAATQILPVAIPSFRIV